jgi:D-alanyl-D-alanine endopeptidase (penicillin-binding protein 7)
MNSIKYLIITCIVIILVATSAKSLERQYEQDMFLKEKALILDAITDDTQSITDIDKSILLDDHEKPIVIVPEPKKEVVKPYISAESYLVANLETGERYLEYNQAKAYPIASVSKLYTSLVVHHLFDLTKPITITQSMLDSYGDAGHLVLDEKLLPNELLQALLLESSNDAAEAFAQSYGYGPFMEQMNGFAQEIGMKKTYFKDSSGLSPLNISSVNDLFVLSRYLYKSESDILKISRTETLDLATTTEHGSHHFVNINPFSNDPDFIGGKTGRTDFAKEAMVTMYNKKIGNKDYPIAIIILRSNIGQREIDTKKLLKKFTDLFSSSL